MGTSLQRMVVVSWVTSMIIFFSPFPVIFLKMQKAPTFYFRKTPALGGLWFGGLCPF